MTKASKDLFDDTTMTFGEHLEALRGHVIKAGLGWVLAVIIAFIYSDRLVVIMTRPVIAAGRRLQQEAVNTAPVSFWEGLKKDWGVDVLFGSENGDPDAPPTGKIEIAISSAEFAAALHQVAPNLELAPAESLKDQSVKLTIGSSELAILQKNAQDSLSLVTGNAQEGFLTYMKVSMISGTVLASPWIFYQIWQFIAAGLYAHERKYVYSFGGMSLGLFGGGVVFCFVLVLPFVLNFLLGFNQKLGLRPMLRFNEYLDFTLMLPLMFGISFQLPIVMLFLERINVFSVEVYREKRRIAIFVISVISMVLTPADPMSMLLMMMPLIVLYELGIKLCDLAVTRSPVTVES